MKKRYLSKKRWQKMTTDMLSLVTIDIDRKKLNEDKDYKTSEKTDNSIPAVSPDDEAILELILEIIESENTQNE